jgi:hypothetical protein
MAREEASPPPGNSFTRFFDRVDRALEPAFGSPPMPADEETSAMPEDQKPCPLCGRPMFEHVIDHSTANTVLQCPTDERLPEREVGGPLNELGMPAAGRRLERCEEREAHEREVREERAEQL